MSLSDTKLATIRQSQKEPLNVTTPSTCCSDCFIPSTGARHSIQLSDIYTPCPDHITDSPACLSTITKHKPPDQIKTLLNVESEIEYSKNFNKKLNLKKSPLKGRNPTRKTTEKVEQEIYEIASEADDIDAGVDSRNVKICLMTDIDKKNMIRVNGKEELPCVEGKSKKASSSKSISFLRKPFETKKSLKKPIKYRETESTSNNNNNILLKTCFSKSSKNQQNDVDESDTNNNCDDKESANFKYSTLPLVNKQKQKKNIAIPQRVTSDGTKIYYLCDLPKRVKKGQYSNILF